MSSNLSAPRQQWPLAVKGAPYRRAPDYGKNLRAICIRIYAKCNLRIAKTKKNLHMTRVKKAPRSTCFPCSSRAAVVCFTGTVFRKSLVGDLLPEKIISVLTSAFEVPHFLKEQLTTSSGMLAQASVIQTQSIAGEGRFSHPVTVTSSLLTSSTQSSSVWSGL